MSGLFWVENTNSTGHGPTCHKPVQVDWPRGPSSLCPAALDSGVITALHMQPLHLPFLFLSLFFFFYVTLCNYQLSASLWKKHTLIRTQLMRRLGGIHSDLELPPHLSHLQTAGAIGYAFCHTVRLTTKSRNPASLSWEDWRW